MARGCPECEVTIMYNELLEELDDELAHMAEDRDLCLPGRGHEFRFPWTRDKLIRDVGTISVINARVDNKGYDGKWPVPVKTLVSILRQEQALQDRIDQDEARREAQRESETIRNGGRTDR